jgi:hypothetical protein
MANAIGALADGKRKIAAPGFTEPGFNLKK